MKAELEPVPTVSCFLHPRFFGSEKALLQGGSLVRIDGRWQAVCNDCQDALKAKQG